MGAGNRIQRGEKRNHEQQNGGSGRPISPESVVEVVRDARLVRKVWLSEPITPWKAGSGRPISSKSVVDVEGSPPPCPRAELRPPV
eukprot:13106313-Heterocapsa_arctica.AAC.1